MNQRPSHIEDTSYYKIAVENVPLHIILTDPQGLILYANDAVSDITGYTKEEVLGKTPSLWGKQMPSEYYKNLWKTIKEHKETYIGEIINRKKNGTEYIAYVKISPILNETDEIIGYVGIEQDITQQRNNAEKLEVFHSIMQESTDLILLIDYDKRTVIQANKVARDTLGIRPDQIGSLSIRDLKNILLIQEDKQVYFEEILDELPKKHEALLEGAITKENLKTPFEFNINFVQYNHKNFAITTARSIQNPSEKYVLGMGRNITQRKELEERMTDFTSIVSHQLRTPLGGERWLLESLINQEYGVLPEEVTRHLKIMYQNKLDMIDLIGNLLNVSRLEKGDSINDPEDINLEKILDQAILELEPLSIERNVIVERNTKGAKHTVFADQVRAKETIVNLLSNAIKYSNQGNSVSILVEYETDNAKLSISDRGIGIPKDDISNLFKQFHRAKNARQVSSDGSGLGLYFVKMCVDQWNGSIDVTSEENVGSTFSITIPYKNHES